MPVEVIMPKVDMDMATGKIMSWHVAEGSPVRKGEPLFDIETDKAAMEVEAPADGILHHAAPEGAEIPIGTPCGWLYAEGEKVEAQPLPFANAVSTPAPQESSPDTETSTSPEHEAFTVAAQAEDGYSPDTGKIRATPQARSIARTEGIDIATVPGTGPRGRVQADDVRQVISARKSEPAAFVASHHFTAESGDLAVTRSAGGTGSPIVLIHGFASDSKSWAQIEAHLKHRPLIRIDLPGHGKSPKLRIKDFANLVQVVRNAFDALDVKDAHLVGHSLGGAVSLALADTRPKAISSLTLIAPAGLGPQINGDVLNGICRANSAESLSPWLKCLVADENLVTEGYAKQVMQTRSDQNMRSAQTALAGTLFCDATQTFMLCPALNRIEMPTRIIWGKRDAIIPWKHALRAPGNVALHLFEDTGHVPQIEIPDRVGLLIRECV